MWGKVSGVKQINLYLISAEGQFAFLKNTICKLLYVSELQKKYLGYVNFKTMPKALANGFIDL